MTDDLDDAPPLLDVDDVAVSFGDVDVLDGVSLSVQSGEFVGLVGPNGAGKTTLLKAANGVLTPEAGTVSVDGADVHALSSRAASRHIATVSQDTTIAFEFDVEDVVEMGRTPYHGRFSRDPDAGDAIERALERTDTAQFRDRSVDSLSGGERQRVVLARALAQETPVLLLDEPTASLDVNHQIRTLELVSDLVVEEGKAALAAIHDLDLAARFCDRIAVLHDGGVLAAGPPAEVLTREHVRKTFGTDAAITTNPVTGTPTVTPRTDDAPGSRTVHVVGTGTVAARVLGACHRAGLEVSLGVVPPGDVAARTASALDVDAVAAPAFEPPDDDVLASARGYAAAADVTVVVEPLPAGVAGVVSDANRVVRVCDGSEGASDDSDETTRQASDVTAAADRTVRIDGTGTPADVVPAVRELPAATVAADD